MIVKYVVKLYREMLIVDNVLKVTILMNPVFAYLVL